jgi:hypothetical protein
MNLWPSLYMNKMSETSAPFSCFLNLTRCFMLNILFELQNKLLKIPTRWNIFPFPYTSFSASMFLFVCLFVCLYVVLLMFRAQSRYHVHHMLIIWPKWHFQYLGQKASYHQKISTIFSSPIKTNIFSSIIAWLLEDIGILSVMGHGQWY